MNKSLRYISVSHKKASVAQRNKYHISEEEKSSLVDLTCATFPDITGLFLLVTCNRTEIYFESVTTTAGKLRDFLIHLKETNITKSNKLLFDFSNITKDTVLHLLEVSSGLTSSVLGDAEIIYQIKKAYQFSVENHLQGSLLERAMQTIFKNHKRLSNETHFRDGTTSIAYKSLKVVSNIYNKSFEKPKKILLIGAGDIIKQLFKYNSKFNFNNIHISNRTEEKAIALSKKHECEVYSWSKVLVNNFQDFDVIVSAASNCHHLIKNISNASSNVLLIDLAIPENIDKALAHNENIMFYNLEAISAELEETKEKRLAAMGKVREIIAEELSTFCKWLQESPLRALLAEYKIEVIQKVKRYFENDKDEYNEQAIKTITDRVIRKLLKQSQTPVTSEEIDALITEQVYLLREVYV